MPGERAPSAPSSPEATPPPAPEATPAPERSVEDQQNRTRDLEILGNSYGVRLAVDRGIGKVISGTHDRVAKSLNVLSTPKNAYLKFRHDAATKRHSRKEQKANVARTAATNARQMADNSPNRIFKGKWRANRLEKKAQRKEDAANDYKRNKLDPRASRYNTHTKMMENRTKNAERTKQNQESIHTRKIEMFKDRKTLAKGRKEVRKLRREMIKKNANYSEVDAKFNTLSVEQRKKIGEIACRREIAKRGGETLRRQRSTLEARQRGNSEALEANIADVIEKTKSRDSARDNAKSAQELHGEFMQEASSLERQLEAGADQDGNPLSDADRSILTAKIEHAHSSANKAAEQLNEFNTLADRLDTEISSLEQIISKQEDKADSYEGKAKDLSQAFSEQETDAAFDAQIEDVLRQNIAPEPEEQPQPTQSQTPPPTQPSPNDTDADSAPPDGATNSSASEKRQEAKDSTDTSEQDESQSEAQKEYARMAEQNRLMKEHAQLSAELRTAESEAIALSDKIIENSHILENDNKMKENGNQTGLSAYGRAELTDTLETDRGVLKTKMDANHQLYNRLAGLNRAIAALDGNNSTSQ